ncbi:MAG: hypothetical protein WCL44_00425 [bacterium]
MITFLTTAKPFVGATGIRQMNALKSWCAAAPDDEILLFGDGTGYVQAVACRERSERTAVLREEGKS